MKHIPGMLKNSQGVVMVIAICILLAVTALGIGMVTNAAMSSTIAKNYMNKIQSFNAADGEMAVLAQAVIDSTDDHWTGAGGGGGGGGGCGSACTPLTISSVTATSSPAPLQPASNAIDNNTGTRWESVQGATADPSWIYVNLGSSMCIKAVKLMWEAGNAKDYTIAGSTDAATWTTLATKTGMPTGARTDSIGGLSGSYQYIRMNGTARNTIYGYSIYEFDVYGSTPGGGGGGGGSSDTLWPLVSATASSVVQAAANAKDKNTGTRWETASSDPQWIYVATDSNRSVDIVVLDWESASAANYTIQGSTDAAAWTTLATKTGMTSVQHRIDSISGLSGTYKYIRMNGTARTTTYGYSIWEFRVYGPKAAATLAMDTVPMGDYKVVWSIKTKTGCSNCFDIQTRAFKKNSTWGVVFQTPLNQYVERAGGAAGVTPATINVPVVYRDFHQDRSNPEFEQKFFSAAYGGMCGTKYCPNCPIGSCVPPVTAWKSNEFKNMVGRHLDADHKPTLGQYCHGNAYIKYWFRDWNSAGGAKGDSLMPVYYRGAGDTSTQKWHVCGAGDELGGMDSVWIARKQNHDTAYKNSTVYDSLPFTWDAARQLYTYHNGAFFPIDGRGFGADPNDRLWNSSFNCGGTADNSHNFCYTMEIQTTMIKKPNQWFAFSGDDDLWVFINDTLVFDGGGRTHGGGDSVNTNNMPFLADGATYRFSVFYCERHSVGQVCNLETNMIQYTSTSTKQRAWRRDYGSLD